MTYHQIVNKSNTIGATSGAGIAHPSGAPEFIPGLTQLVPLVEQELSILPEHLSSSQNSFCSIFSLLLCNVLMTIISLFTSGHCIVCPPNDGVFSCIINLHVRK